MAGRQSRCNRVCGCTGVQDRRAVASLVIQTSRVFAAATGGVSTGAVAVSRNSPRGEFPTGSSEAVPGLGLCYHSAHMKTIAISIDEASLAAVDRLAQAAGRRRNGRKVPNRSEVVRQALREFLDRRRRHEREERDRRILSDHRGEIERQAASLVAEQADL